MWCVIPAAGRGTRMRGHAQDRPKALLDLADRPLLARLLDALPAAVTHVCVVTAEGDEEIAGYLQTLETSRLVCVSSQPTPLGVADAVYRSRGCVRGDAFLTVMGDAWFGSPLDEFVDGWLADGCDGAVLTERRLPEDRDPMGLLDVDEGDVTKLWKGTPVRERIRVAGAFVLPTTFYPEFERLASDTGPEYEIEDVVTRLMGGGSRFGAVPFGGRRRNLNTPADVEWVERYLADTD